MTPWVENSPSPREDQRFAIKKFVIKKEVMGNHLARQSEVCKWTSEHFSVHFSVFYQSFLDRDAWKPNRAFIMLATTMTVIYGHHSQVSLFLSVLVVFIGRFTVFPVSIPTFAEANHPLIQSASRSNDQELLALFQRYPDVGQYFVAIFCRYSALIYRVASHAAKSPVQSDYLFALVWRHVFNELSGLDAAAIVQGGGSFQSWLLGTSASCINTVQLPPVEEIHYDMRSASPPFWCYLDRALDELPPTLRLIIVMAQTFGWSETRISAYLQAEGEIMPPAEVKRQLNAGYQLLETRLPEDIRSIYLVGPKKA